MKINFAIFALSGLILTGCGLTPIKTEEVASIELKLRKAFKDVSAITPGEKYKVKITVTDINGKEIKKPDLSSFNIQSPNQSFTTVKHTQRNITVSAKQDIFAMLHKKEYALAAGFIGSESILSSKTFNIDWDQLRILDFSGGSGDDGSDGADGADGSDGSSHFLNGGDGKDGEDGEDGQNGQDVTLAICYYDVSDLELPGIKDHVLLLVQNLTDYRMNQVLLTKKQPITINTSGGSGGDGGNGGEGGSPGISKDPESGDEEEGDEGSGGRGGDGGNGGSAGNITIYHVGDEVIKLINTRMSGGSAGDAGDAGSFGVGAGSNGWPGSSGELETIQVSKKDFIEKILKTNNKKIEMHRLKTGDN